MAFRLHEALGTQNERYFVAATPPAHSLACLRIDDPVTAAAARLATGVGGLAPHRTGFAPAGRQTEFHDVIASSLPSDQPCLVAPCNNARQRERPDATLHVGRLRATVRVGTRSYAVSLSSWATSTTVEAPPCAPKAGVRRMGCGDVCVLNERGRTTSRRSSALSTPT